MATAALAGMRRNGRSPRSVWVYVGKPPKYITQKPDVMVVDKNPKTIDWRAVVSLHVDVVEVGNNAALLLATLDCIEAAKPKSIGVASRAGVIGINDDHTQLLQKLMRTINAFPV